MNLVFVSICSIVVSFIISVCVTPIVIKIAKKKGIVAKPGGRRIHDHEIPLMGGIGIYLGMLITNLMVAIAFFYIEKLSINSVYMHQLWGVLIGATFIAIMGIIDDKFELKGKIQLLIMIIAGFILAIFNIRITYLSNPLPNVDTSIITPVFWGVLITVIWTVMVTKAVDCIDGMDGLCAGFAAITAFTFTIMAVYKTHVHAVNPFLIPITSSLVGGALGFLVYNFHPAKIFMGTIGSQLIGFSLAAISIMGAYKITVIGILAPILILSIPVFDTTYVVLKRVAEGRKMDDADKTHIHHRLFKNLNSIQKVVLTIYLLTIILCFVALYIFFTAD